MLPSITQARILDEKAILGLVMKLGTEEKRTLYWEVQTKEGPNDLADYSLGSATAQSATGTGWNEIVDSNGRYHLEPEYERIVYHFFYGVYPQQAWVYKRYPSNKDLNSLLGTRAIGGGIGHIDGFKSPYRAPTPLTETFSMKGIHPSFLGYAPFLEPTSYTIYLYFFVTRYDVVFLGVDPAGDAEKDAVRKIASEDVRRRAVVRTMGGHELMDIPSWVESAVKR